MALADDGEVLCGAATCSSATSTTPRRPPRRSTPTAGSTPATSARWTTTATCIVDRKKELIITAGGKNISPANLEAALNIPLVGQACAIGDRRPFVSALVVLDPDVAPVWAERTG